MADANADGSLGRGTALVHGNLAGSSSSESEYSRTLEIITRLSQKYWNTNEKKKKTTTSTEFGYEGDEENSTEISDMSAQSQSASSSTSSMYDFDEPDCCSSMDTSPKKPLKTSKSKTKTAKVKTDKTVSKKKCGNKRKTDSVTTKKSPSCTMHPKVEQTKIVKTVATETKRDIVSNNLKSILSPLSTSSKSVSFSPSSSIIFSNSPVVSLQRLDVSNVEGYESFQRQLRKRKCEAVEICANTHPRKVTKAENSPSQGQQTNKGKMSKRRDSGVILSPPCPKMPMLSQAGTSTPSGNKITKMSLKKSMTSGQCSSKQPKPTVRQKAVASSTPSNVLTRTGGLPQDKSKITPRKSVLDADSSYFGFDSIGTPSTSVDVSPVCKMTPITSTSDYASMSMDNFSMQLSFDEHDNPKRKSKDNSFVPELFSFDDDLMLNRSIEKKYKPSKGVKRTKTAEKKHTFKPKIDKIADRMNDEFEEIEKFELRIEDM